MPSGYDDEPDYGGRPPFEHQRLWPMLLSVVLAAIVALLLRRFI
jgi:hypothetical protein